MIRLVSWNIAKWKRPWCQLAEMQRRREADVALLQEAGSPPDDLAHLFRYEDEVFWEPHLYDRWPLIVQLSDRVEVEWFRQVPPSIGDFGERDIGASGIGTIAAARGDTLRPATGGVRGRIHVCGVDKVPPVHRKAPGDRLRPLSAPHSLGPVDLHRLRRPVPTPHSCRGRFEHVLRRGRAAGCRGPSASARSGTASKPSVWSSSDRRRRTAGRRRRPNRMFPAIRGTSRHTTPLRNLREVPTASLTTLSRRAASTKA